MKTSCYAFLNYAKDILSNASYKVEFVPYLHNNSSSLESTFSVLRATGRDDAIAIEKGLIASNFRAATKKRKEINGFCWKETTRIELF